MKKDNIVKTIKNETFKYRNNIAIKDGNSTITYEKLFSFVNLFSTELKKKGILENDVIAVQYPDSYEYIIICLAVLSLNAVIAPAPMSMPKNEIEELISKMNVKYLICHEENKLNIPLLKLLSNMHIGIFNCKKDPKPEHHPELCSMNPAFIRFSSGTTGKSKGVLLSHQAVLERTEAANTALQIKSTDIVIWMLDMSFHFVVTILLFLRKAATIVISGKQFPISLLEVLNNNNSTFMYASPFHYKMMTDSDMFTPDMLKNTRLAISTAMKLSMSTAGAFYNKFNLELSEAYGIIEVGLPFVHTPFNHKKRGSVGKKLSSYQFKLLNTDRNGCGQICIKGSGFFNAYLNPFKTFRALFSDGWFNTGDIGFLDEDKYLFIVGRKKDIINFAGMKIFPYAVETVIQKCPSVKEVMIYSEDHDTFGEIPCAKIILHDGLNNIDELTTIKKYCYKNLAQYEVPKKIDFVTKIEKTHSGKVKRFL